MHKQRLYNLVSAAAAALVLATSAVAQYTGPGKADPLTSVADVRMKPTVGQPVAIEGRLAKRVGQGQYMFTDGTGEILVQIPRALLQGQSLDAGSMIRIRGRIAQDYRSTPRIDVAQLEVLAR